MNLCSFNLNEEINLYSTRGWIKGEFMQYENGEGDGLKREVSAWASQLFQSTVGAMLHLIVMEPFIFISHTIVYLIGKPCRTAYLNNWWTMRPPLFGRQKYDVIVTGKIRRPKSPDWTSAAAMNGHSEVVRTLLGFAFCEGFLLKHCITCMGKAIKLVTLSMCHEGRYVSSTMGIIVDVKRCVVDSNGTSSCLIFFVVMEVGKSIEKTVFWYQTLHIEAHFSGFWTIVIHFRWWSGYVMLLRWFGLIHCPLT